MKPRKPSKSRRPNKGRPKPTRRRSDKRPAVRVQWENLKPLYDFWGKEFKRFYKLETLASAVEKRLAERDTFILPSITGAMGQTPIVSLRFELFQEGKFQHIFRVQASNAKRKRGNFAMVAAKNAEEFSQLAKSEHANLVMFHKRAPNHVVEPFKGGTIYLPDRFRRKEHGREVYCYMTRWLGTHHELGIGRDLQFFVNVKRPQRFSHAQTQALKCRMIEVMLRTYDPGERNCMALPEIASGDFVVTKPGDGPPKVKLIACRNIMTRVTPAKLINKILQAKWNWSAQTFRLRPDDPKDFLEAMANVLGKKQALGWLSQYRAAVKRGGVPKGHYFSMGTLDELGVPDKAAKG